MRKIANAKELQAELQSVLAYAQSPNPSRERVANELQVLAERVAVQGGRLLSDPMFIGDYAATLHGGPQNPPLEAWYVSDTGKSGRPEKVLIEKVYGASNENGRDYALLVGGHRRIGTTYLFPVKGYRRPIFAQITDKWGTAGNWVALPNSMGPGKLDQWGIDLGQARVAKTADQWVEWIDKTLSIPGQDLAGFANHLMNEGRKDLSPEAQRISKEVYRLARELDERIGELIVQVGRDSVGAG